MEPSTAFQRLVNCFYQGSIEEHQTPYDWIDASVNFLKKDEQKAVKAFLTDLLIHCKSDEDLEKIWLGGGANYAIQRDQIRAFFTIIRNAISD